MSYGELWASLTYKSQLSVYEAAWLKDREVRKMLFHKLYFFFFLDNPFTKNLNSNMTSAE